MAAARFRLFRDRHEAGVRLAQALSRYAGRNDVVVLGLPRGGVPVAYEVAQRLGAPLDVFVVRKVGIPGHEEVAMGALATGGVRVVNRDLLDRLGISDHVFDTIAAREEVELERREQLYRGARPATPVRGRTVLLVDDGLATGSTLRAAVKALKQLQPARVVVAVPVAPVESCNELRGEADDVVCLVTPEDFRAVGAFYEDFSQTTDEEVQQLLEEGVPQRA
jgi:predicted phosphoribosyltransferase